MLALCAAAISGLLIGCGAKEEKPATQAAAKVNREEITVHQINAVLQQQRGVTPDQADEASRRALERLIDQELALQKAAEIKIDRDPRVMLAIEAARRDIVSRAYAERIGEGATKPTPAEIKKYYDDNPALFRDRRVYQLQELAIEAAPSQVDGLRSKLQSAKNINEFVEYLKANKIRLHRQSGRARGRAVADGGVACLGQTQGRRGDPQPDANRRAGGRAGRLARAAGRRIAGRQGHRAVSAQRAQAQDRGGRLEIAACLGQDRLYGEVRGSRA